MNQQLRVDPERLHRLAAELCGIAENASRAVDDLRHSIAAAGACWGDDQPGQSFERYYLPGAQDGVQALDSSATTLQQMGVQVAGAADAFEAGDSYSAAQLEWWEASASGGPGVGAVARYPGADDRVTPFGPDRHYRYPAPGFDVIADPPMRSDTDSDSPASADVAEAAETPSEADRSGQHGSNGAPSGGPGSDSVAPAVHRPVPTPVASSIPGRTGSPASGLPARLGTDPPIGPVARGSTDASTLGSGRTPWSSRPAPPTANGPRVAGAQAPAEQGPPRVAPPPRPTVRWPAASTAKPPEALRVRAENPTSRHPSPVDRVALPPSPWAATAADVMRLANEMATRHGLRITGFAAAGLDEPVMREIAAAIDRILDRYRVIDLRSVEIADLVDGSPSRLDFELIHDESGAGVPVTRILLERTMITHPAALAEAVRTAAEGRNLAPGSAERPVYSTIVRELGHALDHSGGFAARRMAQRALITEYCRVSGVASQHVTLGRIVEGYRYWRGQLSGCAPTRRFVPGVAVAEAFTEVELGVSGADGPAAVLHRLLVDSASRPHPGRSRCASECPWPLGPP